MKIAVTGGTGFLGRYILSELAGLGHTCRCWRRPKSRSTGLEALDSQLEWVAGKLGSQEDAATLVEGCDAVVHAALMRQGPEFRGGEGNLIDFVEANLVGSLQLMDTARRASVERFVFISSCAVHEEILDDRPLDETHPLWSTNHYGAHKAALEKFVHSFGKGMDYPICALRPTGIYGLTYPVQRSKWFSLVQSVVRGENVNCLRGGKEVHAADVARAVSLLLQADGIAGQAYNCCDSYISEYDVATYAKEITGSDSVIEGKQTAPRHQIVTDKIAALGMEFGGRPRLEATIGQLVEHMR
ncbi:MAG: nucleoside-diphosphate sugar epimerase [Planctomycetaceae bacterium]|nr:nucleoside-diphosphate sugar epimerase [Planctomycetaceae bacterium]MBP62253.1 nucleoside-diphosphate sugar epimerase [Planctomycetaceae bacterium]